MKTKCIEQRNFYTQNQLKSDFTAGLRELEQELREDKENPDDGGEDSKRPPKLASKPINIAARAGTASFTAFCVTSKAYQKYCRRFRKEQ